MVPGIALLVVGILGVLVGVANIASVVGEWNGPAPNPAYRSGQYAGATVSLIWGIIVTIGGICFTTLRAHGMAKTGAIFALLPCNPCCLLGLPFGIWALNVMKDRDVYDAFQ